MSENRKMLEAYREEIERFYNGFEDEDGEEVSLWDYFNRECLDYEITIDSQLNYKSCKIWITLGGPNVWIDTAEREIKLAWWTEKESLYLDSDICDELDNIAEEYYNCR